MCGILVCCLTVFQQFCVEQFIYATTLKLEIHNKWLRVVTRNRREVLIRTTIKVYTKRLF